MEKKRCNKCRRWKRVDPDLKISEFYRAAAGNGRYQSQCKKCVNARTSRNYHIDQVRQREIRRQNVQTRRDANRGMILAYLLEHPCVDCGESDPVVLEFDHLKNKRFQISQAMHYAIAVIQVEIAKCDVVCANCHKRRTAHRSGNWYKSKKAAWVKLPLPSADARRGS